MAAKKEKVTLAGALGAGAVVTAREPVLVPRYDADGNQTGENLTLWVRQLGALELQDVWYGARAEGRTGVAELVAAAVSDDEGNRFDVEEVHSLRTEIAKILTTAALKVNRLDGEAGN